MRGMLGPAYWWPRQVVLQTTDGGQFTYLVKGLEDLRLDQRVLQWMQAASDALQRASGRRPHGASAAVPLFAAEQVLSS